MTKWLGTLLVTTLTSYADQTGPGSTVVVDSAGIRIATSAAEGSWTDDELWTAEVELRIGREGVAEYEFGSVAGLTVANDGSIYVLDDIPAGRATRRHCHAAAVHAVCIRR